ncbi:hypothetical protein [Scytonema sp. NUACC26]
MSLSQSLVRDRQSPIASPQSPVPTSKTKNLEIYPVCLLMPLKTVIS